MHQNKIKKSRRPRLKHIVVVAWSKKWMDLKGIQYSKSNSDKVNVNISMYTLALFMYYPDIIVLYASL